MQCGHIFVTLVAVVGRLTSTATATPPDINLDAEVQGKLIKEVGLALIRGYGQELVNLIRDYNQVEDSETRATLFPPFPDEDIPLDPLMGTIPQELGDIVTGSYDFQDVIVKGAASIFHDYQVKLLPLPITVTFNLTTGNLSLGGTHDTQLFIIENNNFTGKGLFDLKVVDPVIGLEVRVMPNLVTGRIRITKFVLDLSYEDFGILFDGLELNGLPINWVSFNAMLNNYVKGNWPEIQASLTQLVLNEGNALLQKCTITELAAGDFSCFFDEETTEESTGTAGTEATTDNSQTPIVTGTNEEGESTTAEPENSGSGKIEQVSTLIVVFAYAWIFV